MMRLGSACSGVGCIDLGLERAGFEPAWQIEIDPTCRAVLERHWPTVERFHDLKDASRSELPPVDLIAGGTPCQDLSVAGKGAGLDGERSGIFFDFVRLADSQPWAFVLWENVAGALSSGGGQDFAICLEGFTGLRFEVPREGWRNSGTAFGPLRWCTWRLLDAQHFGVAQRRRRLWVVCGPRGRCGPEVLLERESVRRDPAASGEAGTVAATLSSGCPGSGRRQEDDDNEVGGGQSVVGTLQTAAANRCGCDGAAAGQIVSALTSSDGGADDNEAQAGRIVTGPLGSGTSGTNRAVSESAEASFIVESPLSTRGYGYDQVGAESQIVTSTLASHGTGGGYRLDDREARGNQIVCHTLRGEGHDASEDGSGRSTPLVVASPLTASMTTDTAGSGGTGPKNLILESRPRRLTPRECERLQGLPDDHTRWRSDGSTIADGPRYRMIGNGAAVPNVEWIGRRIAKAIGEAVASRERACR